jgi:hypothetical protein
VINPDSDAFVVVGDSAPVFGADMGLFISNLYNFY